jgi:hypothetical protein
MKPLTSPSNRLNSFPAATAGLPSFQLVPPPPSISTLLRFAATRLWINKKNIPQTTKVQAAVTPTAFAILLLVEDDDDVFSGGGGGGGNDGGNEEMVDGLLGELGGGAGDEGSKFG